MLAPVGHGGYSALMLLSDSLSQPQSSQAFPALLEAVRRLTTQAEPLGVERLALAQAGGRVLARPVYAAIDQPRRDAAAMDGYALGGDEAGTDGPATRWHIMTGNTQGNEGRPPAWAVRVATGAPVPPGTRQVLPIERAEISGAWVSCRGGPIARSHIRARGSDLRMGDVALAAGRRIDPRALVASAAADADSVDVHRVARVAVLVRGDALVDPGDASRAVSVATNPDVLGDALRHFVAEWGGLPIPCARIGEDPAVLVASVAAVRDDADVIVLVGGAAHGARDATTTALAAEGLDLVFDGLTIRPGRPTWYGRVGTTHVLALPGNPTAAMTVARLLLAPLLARLGGAAVAATQAWEPLPLLAPIAATGARAAFLCAVAEEGGVRVLERSTESDQMMLASADRLVGRPADGPALPAGAIVPTLRF